MAIEKEELIKRRDNLTAEKNKAAAQLNVIIGMELLVNDLILDFDKSEEKTEA